MPKPFLVVAEWVVKRSRASLAPPGVGQAAASRTVVAIAADGVSTPNVLWISIPARRDQQGCEQQGDKGQAAQADLPMNNPRHMTKPVRHGQAPPHVVSHWGSSRCSASCARAEGHRHPSEARLRASCPTPPARKRRRCAR